MATALHIQLVPEWEAIQTAWAPCDRVLAQHGLTRDEAYGLCMVVQELLENAVKYGRYGDGRAAVHLALEVAPGEVTIEVRNPVGADSDDLKTFDRTIRWIRGFQDPFEAYVEALKVVSGQDLSQGRSGLGLPRIAYEGRCTLDFYLDEADTLAVSAVWRR